ncbi:hypothetical protein [Absidia glauca]|uniref:Uncharacterized protein n=1 Tax=Absidia glauca TaxID=4829 RepID=A0A163LR50_ABSGL|nr:hypothetical protein [Absidia glauca]
MEPVSSKSLVEERERLYNTLCNKYTEHLLAILSPEELERFFPEEYTKGADLQETSLEMTRFAQQHLKESFDTVWKTEHIADRLKGLETILSDPDFEADTNLLTKPDAGGFSEGPTLKLVPQPKQIVRAETYRSKMDEIVRLNTMKETLRDNSQTRMLRIQRKKKELAKPTTTLPPTITPPRIDPSSY